MSWEAIFWFKKKNSFDFVLPQLLCDSVVFSSKILEMVNEIIVYN